MRDVGDIRAGQAGDLIGVSPWVTITQTMIDRFGDVTLDPDPMHVDLDYAAKGPFGQPIAFGFLTMSLLSHFAHAASSAGYPDIARDGFLLNYGFDRVRLLVPVPVGGRVRGNLTLKQRREDERGRVIVTYAVVVELEGSERPALIADWLFLWQPPAADRDDTARLTE